MNRQIRRMGVALLVLFGALFVQLNVVQVLRAQEYEDHPENRRAVTRDYFRPRGQIVSADGSILARSVEQEGKEARIREYPEHELFGQITGYFSLRYNKDGVERTYNDELAGRGSTKNIENLVDLLIEDDQTRDVHLTLHKEVQQAARDALGDRPGSVVALDPRDGSVLAMWSFPSYDPEPLSSLNEEAAENTRNLLLNNPQRPLLPRSFRESYFPGSTFKVVTAAAGLASGLVTPEQPDYPQSTEYVAPQTNRPLRNFGGDRCGGTLFEILRVSCNTAFAQMGVDIGAERLVGTARDFGFGEKAPLDLPAVATSAIDTPEFFEQNIPLLAQTAIGQQVRATPLQMALVAAGIANGGEIMEPHVMGEVRDRDGEVVRRHRAEVWKRAVSPEVATTVRDAMVEVASNGTARALQVPGQTTAGKTGTAQLGNGTSHAWIIGFAPAEAPRVAIAVIVEAQPGASEVTGGRVAAPIGRAVLEAALRVVPQ
ncbi:MAG TPA: penicillin-binding protein 2 [Acidimicrobiales bacterium]|nr:penicillin-binding protein 2 [Acidimicrobiales bacterium]